MGNRMLGYWVAFAFLSPRSTMPYVPGGAWSFFTSGDRKSTRLNSSHSQISYAVFCLKKKKKKANVVRVLRRKTRGGDMREERERNRRRGAWSTAKEAWSCGEQRRRRERSPGLICSVC